MQNSCIRPRLLARPTVGGPLELVDLLAIMAEEFRVLRPYEFHNQLIIKGQRADGRVLDELRPLKFEVDAIRTADSSSLVKIGNTSLVCGCTTRIVSPKKDSQDNNDDLVNIKLELPPICSSPTGNKTHITEHLLTKTLRDILDVTECFDRSCLYIPKIDKYWSIDLEIVCLNYDGSLLDASIIGVLAALKTLKLKCDVGDILEREFVIRCVPICTSYAIIGDHFICDPNLEEERIAESIFSITTCAGTESSCHINKVGGKAITIGKLNKCIQISQRRAEELRVLIA